MEGGRFVKRKRPNYKRALILLLILVVILLLFYNMESILEGYMTPAD